MSTRSVSGLQIRSHDGNNNKHFCDKRHHSQSPSASSSLSALPLLTFFDRPREEDRALFFLEGVPSAFLFRPLPLPLGGADGPSPSSSLGVVCLALVISSSPSAAILKSLSTVNSSTKPLH